MRNISCLTVLFILLIGCQINVQNETIYFGGQIKNPKDKTVILYKGDDVIATTALNDNLKFMFKLDSINAGLYKFKHGEEYQYIFLEVKDSLLIRLNTWDFDGSLVFSGKGANRNNFLIQLFLENEQEEREFYRFFNLAEKDFLFNVDSIIQVKNLLYKQFNENVIEQSNTFDKLIDAIIYFPVFSNKEKYPIYYKEKYSLDELPKLSDKFYNHRQLVSKNSEIFKDYYSYNNYLWNKIYNISSYKHEKDTTNELSSILLTQINKIVTDNQLKNKMLEQVFINSLFDGTCAKKNREQTRKLFYSYCTSQKIKDKVSGVLTMFKTLKKDSKLPEFYLKNTNDKIINSNQLIGSNTVLYFWPKELNRIQNMAKRVRYLIKKHPNIHFIGIDGQLSRYNWKAYIKANNLHVYNQFQLVDKNKDIFYNNDFPRAVIFNKTGVIQNDFSHISHRNFETLLTQIENK